MVGEWLAVLSEARTRSPFAEMVVGDTSPNSAQDDISFFILILGFEVAFFEVFVAFFDEGGGFGMKALEEREEELGIEGVEDVVGAVALASARCADHDYGDVRTQSF